MTTNAPEMLRAVTGDLAFRDGARVPDEHRAELASRRRGAHGRGGGSEVGAQHLWWIVELNVRETA